MKQLCLTIILALNAATTGICAAGFWHLSGRVDQLYMLLIEKPKIEKAIAFIMKGDDENVKYGVRPVTTK